MSMTNYAVCSDFGYKLLIKNAKKTAYAVSFLSVLLIIKR